MLAEILKFGFYDSDQAIEDSGGLSVSEIFELYGEERFRQSEEKIMLELLEQGTCVIATGGGAPMNPVILDAIKKQSVSIWLKSDVDAIYERIKQSKTRPLLNNDDPKAVLKELLDKREGTYAKADITIQTYGNNAEAALSEMIEAIEDII